MTVWLKKQNQIPLSIKSNKAQWGRMTEKYLAITCTKPEGVMSEMPEHAVVCIKSNRYSNNTIKHCNFVYTDVYVIYTVYNICIFTFCLRSVLHCSLCKKTHSI